MLIHGKQTHMAIPVPRSCEFVSRRSLEGWQIHTGAIHAKWLQSYRQLSDLRHRRADGPRPASPARASWCREAGQPGRFPEDGAVEKPHLCHPERSEGSSNSRRIILSKILRCAQNDERQPSSTAPRRAGCDWLPRFHEYLRQVALLKSQQPNAPAQSVKSSSRPSRSILADDWKAISRPRRCGIDVCEEDGGPSHSARKSRGPTLRTACSITCRGICRIALRIAERIVCPGT
jgi:hypothetical protein